jgi:hypothetical protein
MKYFSEYSISNRRGGLNGPGLRPQGYQERFKSRLAQPEVHMGANIVARGRSAGEYRVNH